ncbi:Ig-like domain-containing protein [Sulfurimonas sp. CS5]|uniref:Ig-like domain-containing protein n=1 Tax=Sulfurimonas sp. CS5 TaxID=3391145 RepID=UPI0039E7AD80
MFNLQHSSDETGESLEYVLEPEDAQLKALLQEDKSIVQTQLADAKEEKAIAIAQLEDEYFQEIEAMHFQEVFEIAQELQLDEHHYSEDFNKLNSEIANYNYEQHLQNDELLKVDQDELLEEVAQKMYEIYKNEDEDSEISKEEAYSIMQEIGYDEFTSKNQETGTTTISLERVMLSKVEISIERFNELLALADIPNPYENFESTPDAFSLANKDLNDLEFELKDGNLIITTDDKKSFTVQDWESWDKTNTHLELPNGTKVNLQALLSSIGVEEGGGAVSVAQASMALLSEDETLTEYLENYEANHTFAGTASDDIIKAYDGDNLVVAGAGNDTVVTGAGDDTIASGEGKNSISGGEGTDTVTYESTQTAVNVNLEEGISSTGDSIEGIENLVGSKFDDYLRGDDGENVLDGGDGNDILSGGSGADTLVGGEGTDLASYADSVEEIAINLKNDYSDGGEAFGDKFDSIEGIEATVNDDVLVGDDEANLFYAKDGDDKISSNAGDDIIFAGTGNDFVKGDDGDDTLYGQDGNDTLIGGAGDDTLIGGEGLNTIIGGEGDDTVIYKGNSDEYQIMFLNEDTILVKSLDGTTKDTVQSVKEIVFDDFLFEIDYENKTLIKKVEFTHEEGLTEEQKPVGATVREDSQATTLATAIMIGTAAAADTEESSTDEMNFFADDPADVENLKTEIPLDEQKTVNLPDTSDGELYIQEPLIYTEFIPVDDSSNDTVITKSVVPEVDENTVTTESAGVLAESSDATLAVTLDSDGTQQDNVEEATKDVIILESEAKEAELPVLNPPIIKLVETTMLEDSFIFDIEVSNSNPDTSLQVILSGVPDDAYLNNGTKLASGDWVLQQNDLIDLKLFGGINNSDDFELTVTAVVSDTNGRVVNSVVTETITIVAVADIANLDVEESTYGLEDTSIPLTISTSLVDDVGGVDGEETITLTIENVPNSAVLSAGTKDSDGIWHLLPKDLENLMLTPGLNEGDDFTIRVTSYTTESENNHVAHTSADIFVEVEAVADTPTLEVADETVGLEDSQILLDIKSSLVDTDGSEVLKVKIENIPDEAVLNQGIKDADGIWHLQADELDFLTVTAKEHDDSDFTIKVTTYSTEDENGDIAEQSIEMLVQVNAVADKVDLNLQQITSGEENLMTVSEDPGFALLDIASEFIDNDGSETVHYIVEGLPVGTSLNQGELLSDGSWKLLTNELENLSIDLIEHSDENFTLRVSAVTTENENGDQEFTSKDVEVQIESVADFAILEVSDVTGTENSFINLDINASLLDTDGSETLEIIIEDVPSDAILNNGVKDSDGKWYLSQDDLSTLMVRPGFNSIEDFELKVTAITTEHKNSDQEEMIAYVNVNIEATPSSANVTVHPSEALEDEPVYLNIEVDDNQLKPTESIYLEIKIPEGFSLNNGEQLNNTTWKLTTEQLNGLALSSAPNYSGGFFVDVVSVIVNNDIENRSDVVSKLPVDIIPVADEAILEVQNVNTLEDKLIHLNIYSVLNDLDGSENLKLYISGIPDGTYLSAGNKVGDEWIVEEKDIDILAFIPPEDMTGSFDIEIKAISTDSNNDTAQVIENITVNLDEVIDVPASVIEDMSAQEDENPYLSIENIAITSQTMLGEETSHSEGNNSISSGGGNDTIFSNGGDDTIFSDVPSGVITTTFNIDANAFLNDGSEKLVIKIENMPDGVTYNVGYIDNNVLIINSEDFDGSVELSYPYQKEIVSFNVVAYALSTDEENPYTKTTSLSLEVGPNEVDGNDFVDAGAGNDIIVSGGGDDIINGGLGADKFDAGDGDDFIIMDADDLNQNLLDPEIINAGSGFDTVVIKDDRNTSFNMGLTSVENFIGGSGNDIIFGGNGSEIAKGGDGADVFYMQGGDDTVYIDADDIVANAGNFVDTGSGYDKIYIEDNVGVDFDVADTNAEEVISGSGNDILRNSGNNTLSIFGMDGNDTLFASDADDILNGGNGTDTIDYSNSDYGVNVNLTTNVVSGGYAQNDIISSFESVIGTDKDDNVVGNSSNNTFFLGAGSNTVDGVGGNNSVIFEGSLADYFYGKNSKSLETNFDKTATVYTATGINELINVNRLEFDDYTIYVDGTNNSPYVFDDKLNATEDTLLTVDASTLLANDFDVENEGLRIVGVKNSTNGVATLNSNGSITFKADENYNSSTNNTFDKNSALYKGAASFEYIVEDSSGSRSTAQATVNVSAVNDAPTIENHYFYRNSTITGHGKLVADDVDSNVDALTVSVVSDLRFTVSIMLWWETYVSKSLTGYTNISGRTVEEDGSFHFDYQGNRWFQRPFDVYSMRNFVIQISDGNESTFLTTGAYYSQIYIDPIVVDLDGDGIEIEEKYYEAHDETLVGVSSDDAILVWDYNQDGTISSALETNWVSLSDTAQNDLEAMREIFDTNKDGLFNENDEEWKNFSLWQDKNDDGLVNDDEFTKIVDSNVESFNLQKDESKDVDYPIDEYANYTTKDGDEMSIGAGYLDITTTDEKLSEEDLLIMQQALVLNEQLAQGSFNSENIDENNVIIDNIFDDYENIEENAA